VQVERLDEHPRCVGDQRVVDDRRQCLAHPVLSTHHYCHCLHSTLIPARTTTSSLISLLVTALALHLLSLTCPQPSASLRITFRSFRYALPSLWNQLPDSLRELRSTSDLPLPASTTPTSSVESPLSSFMTPCFTLGLKPTLSSNLSHLRFLFQD